MLYMSLPLISFYKLGIDYISKVHPHNSREMAYVVVATEYLTEWAEVKEVRTDTTKNIVVFLYENIITRFGCLKILVNDRGTHFLNDMIRKVIDRFQTTITILSLITSKPKVKQ